MPALTREDWKTFYSQGILPPRHPRGCPQNMLRMWATHAFQKGVPLDEIRAHVDAEMPRILHKGHS